MASRPGLPATQLASSFAVPCKEAIATALIRHFGSIKALSRASFQQLRQFLLQRKAEAVMAAFSVSMIAESEHARSDVFDNPESVYRACADMKLFIQEVFIRSLSRYAQAAARVSLFLPILVPEETLWIMPQKRPQRWGCE